MRRRALQNSDAVDIYAGATRFYSFLDFSAISWVDLQDQARTLVWCGVILLALNSIVVLGAILAPPSQESLIGLLSESVRVAPTRHTLILSAILCGGVLSILLSTADGFINASLKFVYENVLRRNSRSEKHDIAELNRVRLVGGGIAVLAFVVLGYLNYFRPNVLQFLFELANGAAVFAPMVCFGDSSGAG